jgi:protein-disulfide isomerase
MAPCFPTPTRSDKNDLAENDKTTWKVPIGTSPVRGADTALVTIVELADFQCPFSKRVQETLKRLRETYGDKIRIVWKTILFRSTRALNPRQS